MKEKFLKRQGRPPILHLAMSPVTFHEKRSTDQINENSWKTKIKYWYLILASCILIRILINCIIELYYIIILIA